LIDKGIKGELSGEEEQEYLNLITNLAVNNKIKKSTADYLISTQKNYWDRLRDKQMDT